MRRDVWCQGNGAIRQLVDLALRELSKRAAIEAHRQGRLPLREFGRVLGLDSWRVQDLLMSEGVAAAQGIGSKTADALDAAVAETR